MNKNFVFSYICDIIFCELLGLSDVQYAIQIYSKCERAKENV